MPSNHRAGWYLIGLSGRGCADTPGNLQGHLVHNRHQLVLIDTNLRFAAPRQSEDGWMLIIVYPKGRVVAADSLPHWRVEQLRPDPRPRLTWWQRLIYPNAT